MQDTSLSADADQLNIDEDKIGTDKELEKATSNEQTIKEISDEVVDESPEDLPPPSEKENAQVSMSDDEELPPPAMDELPSELAELKEGSESNESPEDLPPPSEEENAQASMSDDEELPPPSVEELPAELAKLKEDGGEENSEIENPEIGKESSAT
jgi:hypothetical protein